MAGDHTPCRRVWARAAPSTARPLRTSTPSTATSAAESTPSSWPPANPQASPCRGTIPMRYAALSPARLTVMPHAQERRACCGIKGRLPELLNELYQASMHPTTRAVRQWRLSCHVALCSCCFIFYSTSPIANGLLQVKRITLYLSVHTCVLVVAGSGGAPACGAAATAAAEGKRAVQRALHGVACLGPPALRLRLAHVL